MRAAACLISACEACGWPGVGAGPPLTEMVLRPGLFVHGTLLTTAGSVELPGDDGPILNPKLQMTSSAWPAAQLSRPACDRLVGTVTPWYSSRVGAASTHTAQTTMKPAATRGTMMASPAGIRAR